MGIFDYFSEIYSNLLIPPLRLYVFFPRFLCVSSHCGVAAFPSHLPKQRYKYNWGVLPTHVVNHSLLLKSIAMPSASERLAQVARLVGTPKSPSELPWDPELTTFPTRKNLPSIPGAPEGAAWVWGKDDQVGENMTFVS